MFSSIEKRIGMFAFSALGAAFCSSLAYIYVLYLPAGEPAHLRAEVVKETRYTAYGETSHTALQVVEWIEDLNQTVVLDVPFTSQAPYADWNNDVYQYGCEEASLLMAMHWVKGDDSLDPETAQREIAAMSQFEKERTGNFHDTSAEDTAQLMRDYFGYSNVEVRTGIGADDIKRELINGNLVIVPVNGRIIKNPHYTSPPMAHMFVIVGYDSDTQEFIINDPGTSYGERYRHAEEMIEAGLQDYPTGHNEPIMVVSKVMIVIRPLGTEQV